MPSGLRIVVTWPDEDYLGIEIIASSDRFAGATKIYAGRHQLATFADAITGFPASAQDQRTYVFGTNDTGAAGGFCALWFYCWDLAGHAAVTVEIEDDNAWYPEAAARFTIPVLPADLDAFIGQLRRVDDAQAGEAGLESRD